MEALYSLWRRLRLARRVSQYLTYPPSYRLIPKLITFWVNLKPYNRLNRRVRTARTARTAHIGDQTNGSYAYFQICCPSLQIGVRFE